jgi:Eukaryotic aspartyl protease
VLGGYNAALVKPNNVDFQMGAEDDARDLTVSVRGIGLESKTVGSRSLHDQGFSAVIDSGVSHYWLPPAACRAFEEAFKLVYNETVGLYFINEDQHTRLQSENPSVTFTLGNDMSNGPEVTFSLPYASFELRINEEYPLVPGWSRYFPLRKASDPMQYTLGRAFLQETYLTANYERRNFSVSARAFEADKFNIVAIRDPAQKNPDDISGAATYGLIAGGCALAGILILFLAWRCSRRRGVKDNLESQSDKTELDSSTGTVFELDKANEIFELNGKPSRVEAPNPDFKCEYDVEDIEADEQGPFELPASEPSASTSAPEPWGSFSPPPTPDDELISPIEGTISTGAYTVSTYHNTVSPITPIDHHPVKDQVKGPVKEKR